MFRLVTAALTVCTVAHLAGARVASIQPATWTETVTEAPSRAAFPWARNLAVSETVSNPWGPTISVSESTAPAWGQNLWGFGKNPWNRNAALTETVSVTETPTSVWSQSPWRWGQNPWSQNPWSQNAAFTETVSNPWGPTVSVTESNAPVWGQNLWRLGQNPWNQNAALTETVSVTESPTPVWGQSPWRWGQNPWSQNPWSQNAAFTETVSNPWGPTVSVTESTAPVWGQDLWGWGQNPWNQNAALTETVSVTESPTPVWGQSPWRWGPNPWSQNPWSQNAAFTETVSGPWGPTVSVSESTAPSWGQNLWGWGQNPWNRNAALTETVSVTETPTSVWGQSPWRWGQNPWGQNPWSQNAAFTETVSNPWGPTVSVTESTTPVWGQNPWGQNPSVVSETISSNWGQNPWLNSRSAWGPSAALIDVVSTGSAWGPNVAVTESVNPWGLAQSTLSLSGPWKDQIQALVISQPLSKSLQQTLQLQLNNILGSIGPVSLDDNIPPLPYCSSLVLADDIYLYFLQKLNFVVPTGPQRSLTALLASLNALAEALAQGLDFDSAFNTESLFLTITQLQPELARNLAIQALQNAFVKSSPLRNVVNQYLTSNGNLNAADIAICDRQVDNFVRSNPQFQSAAAVVIEEGKLAQQFFTLRPELESVALQNAEQQFLANGKYVVRNYVLELAALIQTIYLS